MTKCGMMLATSRAEAVSIESAVSAKGNLGLGAPVSARDVEVAGVGGGKDKTRGAKRKRLNRVVLMAPGLITLNIPEQT